MRSSWKYSGKVLARFSDLIEQRHRYWRWRWIFLGLAIILAILVPIIVLTVIGDGASSYATNYATSSSTLCQSCHGTGEIAYVPDQKRVVTEAKQGILPLKEERDRHKDLLNEWKKSVVRDGHRTYVAGDGQEHNMSLTGTCLSCHPNKEEFCVKCHDYAAVKPKCWDCHNLSDLKAINEAISR